jgi:hypothetical protein
MIMNRTWLTVINEIVNNKENEVSIDVKHNGKSIRLKVGNYNRCMRDYPHSDSIRTLISNIKSTLGYDVTEVIENNNTTYIVKKDGLKNIRCNSEFLYNDKDIEPDIIDCEYTGAFILKKASAYLQNITFEVAGHRVCVNLTHMAGKSFIVAELDVNGCEKNILCKRVLSVESISDELNELTNIEFIIRKTASLIKLYTMYM